jgi:asparagine synthase (glutamine-hydrolysing)
MCGICGIFEFNSQKSVDKELLNKMCKVMNYRGPDEEGIHLGCAGTNGGYRVGLGHRRLSIIDLKSGKQPIHNEDRKIWITFNGEIYNFKSLRGELEKRGHCFYTHTDTEVIVHLYEDYGVKCVDYLRGMFAFAIWDERTKQLFLARDRLGKKPLVYTVIDNKLIFASEIKSLLEYNQMKKEIDMQSLDLYLTYQYVPSPLSIFKNIKKLPPASILICNAAGELKISKFWDIDYRKKLDFSNSKFKMEEIYNQINSRLEEAVNIRMISDVPLGAFLSGGVDSSAVVGMMSKFSSKPVKTFSIGFEEDDFSELEYARTVADLFHTQHHEFIVKVRMLDVLPRIVWHYNEPFADSSCIPSYYVARETGKFVKVALNGDGGDESFGGYDRYRANKMALFFQKLPLGLRKAMWKYPVKHFPESVGKKSYLRQMKRFIQSADKPMPLPNTEWHSVFNSAQKKSLYTEEMSKKTVDWDANEYLFQIYNNAYASDFLDKIFYTDVKSYLPEDLLVKMDIATMANCLETRSPFLDHKFMEFTATLPYQWKIKGLTSKYILKKSLKGFLPNKILNRKKMGFGVPIGKWFRGELKNYLTETLLAQKSIQRGYFRKESIERLLAEHFSGRVSHTYRLWSLLVLEVWHQIFIDKSIKF